LSEFTKHLALINTTLVQVFKSDGTMAFRQSFTVWANDQRHMNILRGQITEQLLQMNMPSRAKE
jgi:hypothetical protein